MVSGNDRRSWRAAGAVHRACACLVVVMLTGGAGPSARPEAIVTVADSAGVYQVRGQFNAPVPPAIAWSVITDYDRIAAFVSSMRVSRAERGAQGLLVHQEVVAGSFPFRRRLHVTLAIHEDAGRRVAFRDVLNTSFRHYQGEWRILPDSLGTRVEYALDARPRAAFPRGIVRGMMSRSARALLMQVREETMRRARAVAAPADSAVRRP